MNTNARVTAIHENASRLMLVCTVNSTAVDDEPSPSRSAAFLRLVQSDDHEMVPCLCQGRNGFCGWCGGHGAITRFIAQSKLGWTVKEAR